MIFRIKSKDTVNHPREFNRRLRRCDELEFALPESDKQLIALRGAENGAEYPMMFRIGQVQMVDDAISCPQQMPQPFCSRVSGRMFFFHSRSELYPKVLVIRIRQKSDFALHATAQKVPHRYIAFDNESDEFS
jgi:hypothetical protein